eukprot:1158896-Pelagomonas_calceolata.AAC.3
MGDTVRAYAQHIHTHLAACGLCQHVPHGNACPCGQLYYCRNIRPLARGEQVPQERVHQGQCPPDAHTRQRAQHQQLPVLRDPRCCHAGGLPEHNLHASMCVHDRDLHATMCVHTHD